MVRIKDEEISDSGWCFQSMHTFINRTIERTLLGFTSSFAVHSLIRFGRKCKPKHVWISLSTAFKSWWSLPWKADGKRSTDTPCNAVNISFNSFSRDSVLQSFFSRSSVVGKYYSIVQLATPLCISRRRVYRRVYRRVCTPRYCLRV